MLFVFPQTDGKRKNTTLNRRLKADGTKASQKLGQDLGSYSAFKV